MKFTVTKDHLARGLAAVQNVVSTRTTLPILSNVLIRAEDGRLHLTATDLDVTISASVEATVAKSGATTIPVKKLGGIVREIPTGEFDIEVDDKNNCSLRAGSSFYKIHGLSSEEFPPAAKFKETKHIVMPQDKLRGMLRKTSYAMSADETRYVLNGLLFSLKDHKLTLVATDGRRLALVDEEVDVPAGSEGDFIIPSKAIGELGRLLADKGNVEIKLAENQASFTLMEDDKPGTVLMTKLIEGNYPNYRQVIPAESKERIQFAREELLGGIKRADIMTSDKSNSVKLAFTKNNLAITANTPDVGEARESIAINYKGGDFAIAFNPAYLMDPLKALETDEVFFELSDELSPGVVKINGPFLYVIMPMRMS
ncbi:MAG: DNA polymerase III subunit beta [Verrucomicrobiae bacterium]|nr:DNA polymerase III subunit beta [Verrucomicrobiae bacterium]